QAFLSVTSTLSVAAFGDRLVLQDLLQEMQQQSPALSFGPLQPDGRVAVQGPFPALQGLRDFLLLKAESLPEQEKGEGRSLQRTRRRQEQGGDAGTGNPAADGHAVVLDTDIYHYMRHFVPQALQGNGVALSGVTEGDITTVSIGNADPAHGLRLRRIIESNSAKLQKVLRKERLHFREQSGAEKRRCRELCERLKPRYPKILVLPYDTHIDVIGNSSDVFRFAEEVK
ncbi:RBM43 protein, partial [Pomatostomus ruficeps]|nr:RBM43 protein [Pomatostomus ruficeps]